jgi:hypothetical protein
MAILALMLVLVAAVAAARHMPGAPLSRLNIAPPRLGAPASAIAAGVMLALGSNVAITGQLAFTPGGSSFIFGRLVQDGIVKRYLDDQCPDPAIRLCGYQDALPDSADGWLWGPGTPLYKLGGPDDYGDEERRIILDTLRMYPLDHLRTAFSATLQQLVKARTVTSIRTPDNNHAIETLERLTPALMPAVEAARQQREGALDLTALNRVHVPVALLGMALLPIVIVLGARRMIPPRIAAMALTVAIALLANAAISGILSNPVDRYQSRLIWLAPLMVGLAAMRRAPTRSTHTRYARPRLPSGPIYNRPFRSG